MNASMPIGTLSWTGVEYSATPYSTAVPGQAMACSL